MLGLSAAGIGIGVILAAASTRTQKAAYIETVAGSFIAWGLLLLGVKLGLLR